jgi:hypothetical protein
MLSVELASRVLVVSFGHLWHGENGEPHVRGVKIFVVN